MTAINEIVKATGATLEQRPQSMRRVALASMAGATLEWYDFTLYNAMAALVFNKLFFPSYDPLVGTILAFSTYAVGYVSRPLGGVLFGRIGDRHGRRIVLMTTLILMGGSSLLIGLLPAYESIGVAAPLVLVVLRFVQGAALGGDWAAAVLLSTEHGSSQRRGLHASWAQLGPSAGTLLATGALGMSTRVLSDDGFISWGWRVPFLASLVLVAIGFWIRCNVAETPTFQTLEQTKQQVKAPVREVFRHHWRSLLIAGGVRIGTDVVYALIATFSLTYVVQVLKLPREVALVGVLTGAALQLILIPLFGALSDRIGRRPVYAIGVVGALVWSFAIFSLMDMRESTAIAVAIVVGFGLHAAMYGPQASFVTEQFDAGVRFSGSSIAYTFAGVLGGGFAPLIILSLFQGTGGTTAISIYVCCALGLTALALAFARETSRRQS